MRPFSYEAPTDLATAVARASVSANAHVTSPIQYKGGGTTLIDLMKLDVMRPDVLVDITGLRDEAMHRIDHSAGELRIGSLVSMATLHEDQSTVRDYPLLTESLVAGRLAAVAQYGALGWQCASADAVQLLSRSHF